MFTGCDLLQYKHDRCHFKTARCIHGPAVWYISETQVVPHVMLSYQWQSQPVMLQVKERLVNAGYKVWMDVDYMSMFSERN